MSFSATYSPDDNKLRLYAAQRLERELYDLLKAAGFRWAPKQELFVAPAWSPAREDLLLELAGEIGDEDKSLVERAEERSERFEEYGEKRMSEAKAVAKTVDQVAERFAGGQPILVGHHSEKSARKDQERIQNGMKKSIKLWETSKYWADRAAGAVQSAKYKELPAVRARRIKGLESDLRKTQNTMKSASNVLAGWQKMESGFFKKGGEPASALDIAKYLSNRDHVSFCFTLAEYPRAEPASQYEGPMGIWSALDGGIISPQQARDLAVPAYERSIASCKRWIAHYENRLDYERAMLGESGGLESDKTKPEVGGAIKSWHAGGKTWSYIAKVNKVTVSILDFYQYSTKPYRANVPFDKINAVMNAAEVATARAEGRIREVSCGDKVTGFILLDAAPEPIVEPAPQPEPAPAPQPEPSIDDAIKHMKSCLKGGGVQVVVAPTLFPTPKEVCAKVRMLIELEPGDDVLEPSAGTGMLLGAMGAGWLGHNPDCGSIAAVEVNVKLAQMLRSGFPLTTVTTGDFLEMEAAWILPRTASRKRFNKIVMNPPFDNAADIKHIRHAFDEMLEPGGRLVAICANGSRQQAAFRDRASYWEELPAGTFAGTQVRSVLMVLDKAPS